MMQYSSSIMYMQILRYMKINQLEDRFLMSRWCSIWSSSSLNNKHTLWRTSTFDERIENCIISRLLYTRAFFLADLLTMEAHTPSPKPQRYQKKGGDWYNQDYIDGSKTRGKKGTTSSIVCEAFILSAGKRTDRFIKLLPQFWKKNHLSVGDSVPEAGSLILALLVFLKPITFESTRILFEGLFYFHGFVLVCRNSTSKW